MLWVLLQALSPNSMLMLSFNECDIHVELHVCLFVCLCGAIAQLIKLKTPLRHEIVCSDVVHRKWSPKSNLVTTNLLPHDMAQFTKGEAHTLYQGKYSCSQIGVITFLCLSSLSFGCFRCQIVVSPVDTSVESEEVAQSSSMSITGSLVFIMLLCSAVPNYQVVAL